MVAPLVKPFGELIDERLEAAEKVCWSLMVMMNFGGLELDIEWRRFLAEPMQEWVDLAVSTNIMKEGS